MTAAIVRAVRLAAEAALLRRFNAGAGFADARIANQLYVRDEAARTRLSRGSLRPIDSHRKAADEVQAALHTAITELDRDASRWSDLARRLHLTDAGTRLLAIATAYAIDLDVREIVHALTPRRRPALFVETCAEISSMWANADAVAPTLSALQSNASLRWLDVIGSGLEATISIDDSLLAWLLGDDQLPDALGEQARYMPSSAPRDVELPLTTITALNTLRTLQAAQPHQLLVIGGARGSGRRAAARHLAHDVALLASNAPDLRALMRTACSRGAIAYWSDPSPDALLQHRALIAHLPSPLIIACVGKPQELELGVPFHSFAMPLATVADRERAWSHTIARIGASAKSAEELAARYVIGPGTIAEVGDEAARFAALAQAPVDTAALEAVVSRRLSLRIGSFGNVVPRKARLDELVLPGDVLDPLQDFIAMVRGRAQILERWEFARHLGLPRGVSALFSGEPGTGKTMAASVVASELGLELVRIDLSSVVSKFVGETEKNLARIFDEAQDAHAMLLFDEADSLFGKRTELRTAQDRFANLEVNYILQRMESFDGVSVLTTNAEAAIDPALQRRLNFRIRFPEPEVDERLRLWRQQLPAAAVAPGDIPDDKLLPLATRFEMTGGYIKNAIVRAAVIASRANRRITAEDLLQGALHEYSEMGKVMQGPS